MDGYIDDYIKAIRRNEVRDFFFGKSDYYKFNDGDGKRLHYLSFNNCIEILGEQNLYNRLSSDYIDILKENDVTLQEFYDLLMFVVLYYRNALFCYEPDCYHFEWVYPEELTRLFNVNYERLKNEGDTKEIGEFLHELKEYNVDLLNYDRVNVIGSKTVLPRVPRTTEGEFVVPDGIVRIPDYAFAECDKITSVVMPDTVESIGAYAFTGCTSLKKIRLSENLTFVGRPAFGVGASFGRDDVPACSIESIYIPRKVNKIIDFDTFSKCMSLKSIEVDRENPYYASYDGILYTKDMKSLIICPCGRTSKVVVPSFVTELKPYCFKKCLKIEILYIPYGVKKMHSRSLAYCSGLKEIHIGIKENIEQIVSENLLFYAKISERCVLYVPKGTKDIYKKVLSESKDINIIEEDV